MCMFRRWFGVDVLAVVAAKHDRPLEVAWRVSDRNMVLVAALMIDDRVASNDDDERVKMTNEHNVWSPYPNFIRHSPRLSLHTYSVSFSSP